MGSEFLGKKRSIIAAIRRPSFSSSYYLDNNHLLSGQQQPSQQQRQQQQQQLLLSAPQLSILASPYFMAQKKMGSEFLGRWWCIEIINQQKKMKLKLKKQKKFSFFFVPQFTRNHTPDARIHTHTMYSNLNLPKKNQINH